MKRVSKAVAIGTILITSIFSTSCRSMSNVLRQMTRATFTSAKLSDIFMEGSVTQTCIPLSAVPLTQEQEEILGNVLNRESIGCAVGISKVGSSQQEWIFCDLHRKTYCESIPLNARIKFSGSLIGKSGGLWNPSDLKWSM